MASNNAAKAHKLKLIASEFVKQYYTLLNKAPNYIHNFYNDESTFIYGTIEIGSERRVEPSVGREQIENKMKELKLNDCRAKIEQIDCLETIAGGLVIQLIGELSNNGRPMRRFLQTFVLAPCHSNQGKNRQVGDQLSVPDSTLGSESNSSQVNQKFYVMNSIFRYQDDGPDSEFEDDTGSVHVNTSTDNVSSTSGQRGNDHERVETNYVKQQQTATVNSRPIQNQQHQASVQTNQPISSASTTNDSNSKQPQQQQAKSHMQQQQNQHPNIEKQTHNKHSQQMLVVESTEHKRTENINKISQAQGAGNNTMSNNNNDNIGKKTEVPEKSTENTKSSESGQVKGGPPANSESTAAPVQSVPSNAGVTTSTQPTIPRSNEPKTWANIISWNANPTPPQNVAPVATSNVAKKVPNETQQQYSQASNAQTNQQIPQHHQHQDQPSHQQQPNQLQAVQQNQQNDHGQRGQSNRRRNMIRKSSNKPPSGRGMKDRPRPPPASKPVA